MSKTSIGRDAYKHPLSVMFPIVFVVITTLLVTTDVITLRIGGTVVLCATAIFGSIFLLVYAIIWRKWIELREGRTIISLLSTLVFIIDYFAAVAIGWLRFGEPDRVRFITYGALFIVLYWQLALMVSRQMEARRERHQQEHLN